MWFALKTAAIFRVLRACARASAVGITALMFAQSVPPADLPIEAWLNGPERHDIPWQVAIEPGSLTYQQRHVVQVRTTYPVSKLLKAEIAPSDIHVIARFATEDGRWLPGQGYSRVQLPATGSVPGTIDSFISVYLRPGRYKFALMAFDSLHHNGNLQRGSFEVRGEKDDPFPNMDADLPSIDYPSPIAGPGDVDPTSIGHSWALGHGILRLPVANSHPVQLDVVVNLSLNALDEGFRDQTGAAFLMQVSNVLTQLDLRQGCVRFSAIDILRRQTLALGVDGPHVDWGQLEATLEKNDPFTIDATDLAGRKTAPARFVEFLQQATTSADHCDAQGQPMRHVLIVLGEEFLFPPKTEKATIDSRTLPLTRCYYLERSLGQARRADDISNLLKPLQPERIAFVRPIEFRKALARIVADLERSN
jgi:hypothetical protein